MNNYEVQTLNRKSCVQILKVEQKVYYPVCNIQFNLNATMIAVHHWDFVHSHRHHVQLKREVER